MLKQYWTKRNRKRNNNNSIEQHKASVIIRDDSYSHFRDVPNFSSNNSVSSSISHNNPNDVIKLHNLMKKIAGGNNSNT
jgi:hypothetical protein